MELELDRLTIWIDPLDGTKNFVLGDLEGVTTLIGVAYDENPIFGVIHQVFGEGSPSYFGGPEFGVYLKSQSNISEFRAKDNENFSITYSRLHKTSLNQELLPLLNPDKVINADGCGFKTLQVISGLASTYIVDTPYTFKWDICPTVAIMRTLNGYAVDFWGNEYRFDKNVELPNSNGVIITFRSDYKDRVIDAFKSLGRESL